MKIDEIYRIQKQLAPYHGSCLLQNIPELAGQELLAVLLGDAYGFYTVSQTREALLDLLSVESIQLQSPRFAQAMHRGDIITGAQRTPENKRLELYDEYNLYGLLQIAFSPDDKYFHINPTRFRKWDNVHNRKIFEDAIDALVIDPSKIPPSSLTTLGIKQLDPDCQNLKDIFKDMVSLKYKVGDKTKRTPTVNLTKDGKFVTLSSQSVIYPVEGDATQGEKRKTDKRTHISVYPDIFSMLRREWHILESLEDKKEQYQEIKKMLIVEINHIDRNKKCYGVRLRDELKEIIGEIDDATNAKIVAQKLYKLYKLTGKNNVNDKLLLESAITGFGERIGELIGISGSVQFHALALEDELWDQKSNLEMFHAQAKMALRDGSRPTNIIHSDFCFALQNYCDHRARYLKEPFRTFNSQILRIFGDPKTIKKKFFELFVQKADVLLSLQRSFLNAYVWEHDYKEGLITLDELAQHMSSLAAPDISSRYPNLYHDFFQDIDLKREEFSPEFSYEEITQFFAELKDMSWLESKLAMIQKQFNH